MSKSVNQASSEVVKEVKTRIKPQLSTSNTETTAMIFFFELLFVSNLVQTMYLNITCSCRINADGWI